MSTQQAITAAVIMGALALPVAAQTPSPAARSARSVNLACMQASVEKRDNAMVAAFDAFSASARSAFIARRDALKAAWGITDRAQRRAALRNAWSAFRASRHAARGAFRTARHAAWTQFRTDARACRGVSGAEEPANEASDLTI